MSLFLLCIDILSRMLAKEKHHLNFKGIKITITNPFIAHLLFANDLVIFCRATKEEEFLISSLLGLVSLPIKKNSQSILATALNLKPKFRSLIPLASKSATTNLIIQVWLFVTQSPVKAPFKTFMKTTVNLKGWKSKVLSQVSRSIVIKVVAQAIPTYVMSTNLFPKVFVTK